MEPQRLVNASIVGGLLAVLAIGLFVLLYVALGSANVQGAPRLFGALCTPPVVIAGLVGVYAMWLRRRP